MTSKDVVSIYETSAYIKKSRTHLTANERDAIRLLLADNPFRGIPHKIDPRILTLDWGQNEELEVTYLVTTKAEICLLEIGPKKDRIKKSQTIKKHLATLAKIGVIVLVKEGAKLLYKEIKEMINLLW